MPKQYVIFDLDNCLADDSARIPLIDWDKSNPTQRYARYHAACGQDPLVNEQVFFQHFNRGDFPIFMTGRPASVKQHTLSWLHDKLGLKNGDYELMMRPVGDDRPSVMMKRDMLRTLADWNIPLERVVAAYDDRTDILEMYASNGINAVRMIAHDVCAYTNPNRKTTEQPKPPVTAADILGEMAETYRERNKVYGDNFRRVGHVMQALHPDGVHLHGALDHELFHLWSMLIVKASRFAVSGLTHEDSIHDLCVYGAMIEGILKERKQQ